MYMLFFFFFNDPATPEIYTLSLHDALPILPLPRLPRAAGGGRARVPGAASGQRRAIRRLAPGARGRPRLGVVPESRRRVRGEQPVAPALRRYRGARAPRAEPRRDVLLAAHAPRGRGDLVDAGRAHGLGVVAGAAHPPERQVGCALVSGLG